MWASGGASGAPGGAKWSRVMVVVVWRGRVAVVWVDYRRIKGRWRSERSFRGVRRGEERKR